MLVTGRQLALGSLEVRPDPGDPLTCLFELRMARPRERPLPRQMRWREDGARPGPGERNNEAIKASSSPGRTPFSGEDIHLPDIVP
ncbi:hypothetical protein NDU88_001589 [Pleurodeles waltl]|uniref:Uncharacterized protein n=1 Tax=Pleurodeles waltl TaxID=8319 RepID=A0AAV7R9I9_PLEWA|nr:hypothetical protein NDU88_001589 [Pleurodeles waltl]